jgi:predicted anti-sigma-YlaC factor YlaD
VTLPLRSSRCERTRAWAALAPDGELSELERRLLAAHLANCAACRSFAWRVAAIATELRAAAGQRPARRFSLPAAHVRRSAYARLRAAGAVAAVASMAFGLAARGPLPVGGDGAVTPAAVPAAAEESELQTIRQLRREALLSSSAFPDRPSRSFGTQPA